jgi:acyl-CoA thioester hydrolase
VSRIGRSSVRYELAVYRNDDDQPAAAGHFVHVYVDRATGRATPIPERTRQALQGLAATSAAANPSETKEASV